MEIIKMQGIGEDDLDIEGAIQGAETVYIDGNSAVFKIESEQEDKAIEIRVGKTPFWNFSIGPYNGQFERNPRWKSARNIQNYPLVTEVLKIEVPEDSVIERIK